MIEVRVEEPREVRAREGSQVSFVCTATSKVDRLLLGFNIFVVWTKFSFFIFYISIQSLSYKKQPSETSWDHFCRNLCDK